jgi:hypothetical protein
MRTSTLDHLKRRLAPDVYRREDLLPWSHSVDRHLKELTGDGTPRNYVTAAILQPSKI